MTTQRDTTAPPTDTRSPCVHQAFLLLRTVFTVAPFRFGLDKFVGLLTGWERYLTPPVTLSAVTPSLHRAQSS